MDGFPETAKVQHECCKHPNPHMPLLQNISRTFKDSNVSMNAALDEKVATNE